MKKKFCAILCLLLFGAPLLWLCPAIGMVTGSEASTGAQTGLAYYAEGIPETVTAGALTVSFHAGNTTGEAIPVTATVAVYDGITLAALKTEDRSLLSGAVIEDTVCTVTVTVPETAGNWRIRAFLWNADTMEPLGSVFQRETPTPSPTQTPVPVKKLMVGHNVMNPPTLSVGYAEKETGRVNETATSWRTSAFLPVEPWQMICSETGRSIACPIRYLAAYDADKRVIPEAGLARSSTAIGNTYVVPEGVAFIRLSVSIGQAPRADNGGWMIELRGAENAVIPMDQWDDETANATDPPTGFPDDGGNSLQIERSAVPFKGCIQLDGFPQNIKKGLTVTFSASFDRFTRLTVGKGYDHERGDYLVIDGTAVTWKGFGANQDGKPKAHGLTIQNDLCVTLRVDGGRDGVCICTLESGEQEKTLEFQWLNEQNGIPFAFGEQAMTDVTLSAAVTDADRPVWLFGDSYFGSADNRVIGQLFRLGYGENCLIDGLAGQHSSGAYAELERLLTLGAMPETLVWMLGMNDTADGYQAAVQTLSALAREYDFELILMTVPPVPGKTNPGLIDAYVVASGHRYVDARSAVGADEDGNWYEGYLSEDGIHPTASGARAIAEQLILDVPEITAE